MVAQIKPTQQVNIKETLHDLDLELVLLLDYLQGETQNSDKIAR
jgi:hypothetical protein